MPYLPGRYGSVRTETSAPVKTGNRPAADLPCSVKKSYQANFYQSCPAGLTVYLFSIIGKTPQPFF